MKTLSLLLLLALIGCTVTPKHLVTREISFDAGIQNGGFVGYTTNGYGVITGPAKERYDALVKQFGAKFTVSLKVGDGLQLFTNGTWLIDPEHNRKAQTMNRWRKESVP